MLIRFSLRCGGFGSATHMLRVTKAQFLLVLLASLSCHTAWPMLGCADSGNSDKEWFGSGPCVGTCAGGSTCI